MRIRREDIPKMNQTPSWYLVDKKSGAKSAPIRPNVAFKIGRPSPTGSENGIDIAIKGDSSISRLHAELLIKKRCLLSKTDDETEPHIVITDHSKFGLFVNGEKIDGFKALKANDEVRFGVYESCFVLEMVRPVVEQKTKKETLTSQQFGSSSLSTVASSLKSKSGSGSQLNKTAGGSCVYRKGRPPKDAIRVKPDPELHDGATESQVKIKIKTEPLVVKSYQDLQTSRFSETCSMGSTAGRVNFKKFKKVPKASVLRQMLPTVVKASASSSVAASTRSAQALKQKQQRVKLESSQFVSFKNEPFDVDSQFESFMSQNR